jgi:hypothetical protein
VEATKPVSLKKIVPLAPATTRWIYLLLGVSHTLLGINKLNEASLKTSSFVIGVITLVVGITLLILGVVWFSPFFLFSPHILLTDDTLSFKEKAFKKAKVFLWREIKSITYKNFQIEIQYQNQSKEALFLNTDAVRSVEIKKAVRAFADTRQIPVAGG